LEDELNDEFNRKYGGLVKLIDDSVKKWWLKEFTAMKKKSLGVEVPTAT